MSYPEQSPGQPRHITQNGTVRWLANREGIPIERILQRYEGKFQPLVPSFIRNRADLPPDHPEHYSQEALNQYVLTDEPTNIKFGAIDPTGEEKVQVLGSEKFLRAYEYALLIKVSSACLVHCMHCFRQAEIGPSNFITGKEIKSAAEYIQDPRNTKINTVVISGGDIGTLPPSLIKPLIETLMGIDQITAIRIDSRVLSTDPESKQLEILTELMEQDKRQRFKWIGQFNHVDDLNHPVTIHQIRRLQKAGVSVFNQFVLLKHVNDRPGALEDLLNKSEELGVNTHYGYILDHVKGGEKFYLSDDELIAICDRLQHEERVSGLAKPTLCFVGPDTKKHTATLEFIRQFLQLRHYVFANHPEDTVMSD